MDLGAYWVRAATKAQGWARRVVGGRYSRGAWALATAGIVAALSLLFVPLNTFLWTSPKPLRDIYLVSALAVMAAGVLALILVFAKRLHDQRINGLWALFVLVAFPWALGAAVMAWVDHLYETKEITYASSSQDTLWAVAGLVWAALVLFLALRAPRPGAEQYGSQTKASAVLKLRHPVAALILLVVAALVPLSIYAGLLQDGLWVGRKEYSSYGGPSITPPGGGNVLAHCGNANGVSAVAQQGEVSGFTRNETVGGGTWSLVVSPDGTLDIQLYNDRQVLSFRQDGFAVSADGLRLTSYGSLAKEVDRFMVVAKASDYAGSSEAVTVMSFVRREYGYLAIISSTRLTGKGSLLAANFPRASSFMVMADCTVRQEYEPTP
jgi:uncharacterized membrane protein YhaH (DUF805 family)